MNPGSRRRRGLALALAGLVAVLGLTPALTGCGDGSNSAPAASSSSASAIDPASKDEVAAHAVKPANLMAQGWHFDHLIHPGQVMSMSKFYTADPTSLDQLNFALTNHFVNEWHPQTGGTSVVAYTLVPAGGTVNQAGLDLYAILVRVSIPGGFAFIDARQLKVDSLVQPTQFATDIQDAVVGLNPGDVQKVTLANYGTFSVMLTDEQRGFSNNTAPSNSSTPEPPVINSNSASTLEPSTDDHKEQTPDSTKSHATKKPVKRTPVPMLSNDEIIAQLADDVADADRDPAAQRTTKLDSLGDAVTRLTGQNWLQVRATFQGAGNHVTFSNVRTLAGDPIENWVFQSNGRYRVRIELVEGVGPVLTFTCI